MKKHHFMQKPIFSPTKLFLVGLILTTAWISGCTIYSEHSVPDLYPHKGKNILLLQGVKPSGINSKVWTELGLEVEKQVSGHRWLGEIRGFDSQKASWRENQQLRLDLEQFKTSLALAGITEKTLAAKLSSAHKVDHALLYQFIAYPCTLECTSPETWIMRLQLIDLSNGLQIHRVRLNYKPDDDELDGIGREEAALELTRDLLKHFEDSFVVPWHRLRYENLKKLRPQTS